MLIKNITEKIGNTPLIVLDKMGSSKLFAKAEFLNPGGSIKDRVALNIIEKAEERGELKKGMTIIEATSGNTGIGLSLVGLQKGYKVMYLPHGWFRRIIKPLQKIIGFVCLEHCQQIGIGKMKNLKV
jgi:cysteine synthase A